MSTTERASAGRERVLNVVRTRLDQDAENISAGVAVDDSTRVIYVSLITTLSRDGTIISKPTAPLERVIAVTPNAVSVTITIDSRRYTDTVPIYVQSETERLE